MNLNKTLKMLVVLSNAFFVNEINACDNTEFSSKITQYSVISEEGKLLIAPHRSHFIMAVMNNDNFKNNATKNTENIRSPLGKMLLLKK